MIEVLTKDGTLTLKSEKYNECYHSSEGALKETLYKHVLPAFEIAKKNDYFGGEIKILDICFGLGYNTLATILNKPKNVKLKIFSPELDTNLIRNLKNFKFPPIFDELLFIINEISDKMCYKNDNIEITVFNGDAREFIKNLDEVHVIYQDAFSPKVNKELWTIEYFSHLAKILHPKGAITTYSVATPVRCAFYKLGMNMYTHKSDLIRKGTIASFDELDFPKVNFEEKLKRVNCRVYKDNE